MTDESHKEERKVDVDGTYIEGDAKADGDLVSGDKVVHGDSISGDQIIQIILTDLPHVIQAARQTLPEGDASIQRLTKAWRGFKAAHQQLYEWKELHNYLNAVTHELSQFSYEVERLYYEDGVPNIRILRPRWNPVSDRLVQLQVWSATVQYINPALKRLSGGQDVKIMLLDLDNLNVRLSELLHTACGNVELYEACSVFKDAAERALLVADAGLRETSLGLYTLSEQVMKGLGV